MNSRLIASSHDVVSYVLPKDLRNEFAFQVIYRHGRAQLALLQHGVTHNDVFPALSYETTGFDFMVTSGVDETVFMRARGGLRNTILQTGFPRFDCEPTDTSGTKPYILFMPTWRTYLGTASYNSNVEKHASPFAAEMRTSFVNAIDALIRDEQLTRILIENNIEMRIIGHYELEHMLILNDTSLPSNIRMINSHDADVGQHIRDCALLITDWSSVAFDAAYFGRPVCYYQFDEDEFRA